MNVNKSSQKCNFPSLVWTQNCGYLSWRTGKRKKEGSAERCFRPEFRESKNNSIENRHRNCLETFGRIHYTPGLELSCIVCIGQATRSTRVPLMCSTDVFHIMNVIGTFLSMCYSVPFFSSNYEHYPATCISRKDMCEEYPWRLCKQEIVEKGLRSCNHTYD